MLATGGMPLEVEASTVSIEIGLSRQYEPALYMRHIDLVVGMCYGIIWIWFVCLCIMLTNYRGSILIEPIGHP